MTFAELVSLVIVSFVIGVAYWNAGTRTATEVDRGRVARWGAGKVARG